jgi:hypothetical protein
VASFIKTLWSDKIIQALYEDPDLNSMFTRDLESYVRAQGGNAIVLPTLSANSSFQRTDNLSIGSGLPLTTVDVGKDGLTLYIYEYTYGPILMKKLDDIQSNMNLLQKHTNEIAQAAKEYIFTAASTHIIVAVNSANRLPWTGGVSGSKFTFADLKAMRIALNKKKILTNNRFIAMDPDAESYLSEDDYLKNWFAVNQTVIQNGDMPNLAGFKINPTVLVPLTKADGTISGTSGQNVKKSVVGWRRDHMNLVIQTELEITGSENAKLLGFEASFTTRFGLLLEREFAGVVSTQQ